MSHRVKALGTYYHTRNAAESLVLAKLIVLPHISIMSATSDMLGLLEFDVCRHPADLKTDFFCFGA